MARELSWVAIVDDDASVLTALARLLRTRRIEAKTYVSAGKFIAALDDGLPECLIVDLQMPEMNGLELQHYLTRNGIQIPTIVITAHNEVSSRQRCESAGAIAFLPKPLQAALLLAAIDEARSRPTKA